MEQLNGARPSDLRFFRIEEYFRNAERVDALAESCAACRAFRDQIDQTADQVVKAVSTPGAERRQLDDLQTRVNDHLRKAHGFFPPHYHTYMQSVYWTVGLMVVAFLLTFVFSGLDKAIFYSPAFAFGVITGQIIGGKKDRKIRESGKIL